MAYFCDAKCLKVDWPVHKLSCKSITKGRKIWDEEDMAKAMAGGARSAGKRKCDDAAATKVGTTAVTASVPSPAADAPTQKKTKKKKIDRGPDAEGWEPFGAIDQVTDNVNYNRETAVVWEYDKGTRGKPVWVRYPPRVEAQVEGLHEMVFMGCHCYMYRPGHGDMVDGKFFFPAPVVHLPSS
jgi:hypothetical protein